MSTQSTDSLFAALDIDLSLERIAGGNETEVYCTDDHGYVVKVKSGDAGTPEQAWAQARARHQAAATFAAVIGRDHSIPNYFIIASNDKHQVQPVAIQPYYHNALPLFSLDYTVLSRQARFHIARQLLRLIRRSFFSYLKTGRMPDLYGRTSASSAERKRLNAWYRLPWRLWNFLAKRNLLRSHNLLLTASPERRIILVDYDPVQRSKLYQFVYYNVRCALFLRDLVLICVMVSGGDVANA